MKKNIIISALFLLLTSCATSQTTTPTPNPNSTPISVNTKEIKVTSGQTLNNYKIEPLIMPVGSDLYLTLNEAIIPSERSIKTNDETKLKFVSTEKFPAPPVAIGAIGTEIWKFKAVDKGEFDLTFRMRKPSDEQGKYQDAETFKVRIK
ncbi:MAG: protease inhibitor I42 family protein [Candidatus Sericytochromatia bacterium]